MRPTSIASPVSEGNHLPTVYKPAEFESLPSDDFFDDQDDLFDVPHPSTASVETKMAYIPGMILATLVLGAIVWSYLWCCLFQAIPGLHKQSQHFDDSSVHDGILP